METAKTNDSSEGMEFKNVNDALRYCQLNLKAPKNQRNTFGNYNYRSCEDILEALKPLLAKTGAILTMTDDVLMIGSRTYFKANAKLSFNGEIIETQSFAREDEIKKGMDGAQISGASSSYARKYALNAMFLIDDNKDSDNTNKGQEKGSQEPKKPALTKLLEANIEFAIKEGKQQSVLSKIGTKYEATEEQIQRLKETM